MYSHVSTLDFSAGSKLTGLFLSLISIPVIYACVLIWVQHVVPGRFLWNCSSSHWSVHVGINKLLKRSSVLCTVDVQRSIHPSVYCSSSFVSRGQRQNSRWVAPSASQDTHSPRGNVESRFNLNMYIFGLLSPGNQSWRQPIKTQPVAGLSGRSWSRSRWGGQISGQPASPPGCQG